MKYRNKILKSLILVDLEKDIIINNDSNNEALLSKIRNYDLPDEFKKIIVVSSHIWRKGSITYKKSYELITEYPVESLLLFSIKIEQNIYEFEFNNGASDKVARNFYKDIINAGYFEKYIDFLNELFMIKDKEYMETYINNDKKSNKKILKRKMKREVIKQ